MFDVGFAELLIIGIVALLVIGPERLPAAVRTASLWINRIRRGFNEIKAEVQQELHNDSVMQDLRKTEEQLRDDTNNIGKTLQDTASSLAEPIADRTDPVAATKHNEPSKSTEAKTSE